MHKQIWYWMIGLQIVLILATAINITATQRLIYSQTHTPPPRPELPCAAVPMTFIREHPECADHLLRAMNVTNVHVERFNASRLGANDMIRKAESYLASAGTADPSGRASLSTAGR